ncbi:MAG: DapH/DapD/GlmU-related protein [Planctomycetota bacterium]
MSAGDATTHEQATAYVSPWSKADRAAMVAWWLVAAVLFRPSPKFFARWRNALLRRFGARLEGLPFVSQTAVVRIPWHLTMHDRACLGEHAEVYNLGPVTIGARATVAQHVYLCAGTHDFAVEHLPLVTAPIVIGADAFIGAKAIVLPGVTIGEGCIVGAGSVVTKDTKPWHIYAGNPARPIKERPRPRPRDTPPESDRPADRG